MKTKTQIALAWMFMIVLFGITVYGFYFDYREEVRQGRIIPVMYPSNL
jgi:hypothetical protein